MSKKLIILLTFLIPIVVSAQKGHHIKLKVNGLKSDSLCLLYQNYGDKQKILDSVEVKPGGLIEFIGDDPIPGGIYIAYITDALYFQFIGGDQFFSIETDTSDLVMKAVVKNSKENTIFYEYQKKGKEQFERSKELTELMTKHKANKDSVALLKDQQQELNAQRHKFNEDFVKKYPESFFVKVLTTTKPVDIPDAPLNEKGEPDPQFQLRYLQKHYLDNVDFSDDRLVRTPVLHEKIIFYVDKLTVPHPDSICRSVNYVIQKSKANDEVFKYVLSTLFNKYNSTKFVGMDGVFVCIAEDFYLSGDAYWADSAFLSEISTRVLELKHTLIGQKAVDITLIDTTDRPIPLYSIDADYTIVFFYEPDCGHCKKTTTKLLDLYHKYQQYNIEVYGVCTKTDVQEWKDFIVEYETDWVNVADPYYRSNFRYFYDIKSTPRIYVLNKEKEILINKNIGVGQLEKFLRHELGLPEIEIEEDNHEKTE